MAAPVGGTFEDDIICASDQRIAFDAVIAGLPCAMHPIARRDNGANRRRHRSRHRHRRNKRERACSCKGRPHGKSSKSAVLASPSQSPLKFYARERAKLTASEIEERTILGAARRILSMRFVKTHPMTRGSRPAQRSFAPFEMPLATPTDRLINLTARAATPQIDHAARRLIFRV